MAQDFPTLEQARTVLIEAGRAMRSARLIVAREGNLSMRLAEDRFMVSAAGTDKGRLGPDDLVVVGPDGQPEGDGRASTETAMHLEIYRRRADVGAVVHGHPAHCTAFAVAGRALDACLLPEVITTLGCVPLSDYATPSTAEVAEAVGRLCTDHDAFLLRNHGAVAMGPDPRTAVDRLETVEHLAQITWLAEALGGARPLGKEQVEALMQIRGVYGPVRSLPDCRPAED
ncbi:class II aldolase/adducin family protein [bacterium]|nr:MAG: class II aldolase/adducin family protein [bacterium]